jgi:hypothetical protein
LAAHVTDSVSVAPGDVLIDHSPVASSTQLSLHCESSGADQPPSATTLEHTRVSWPVRGMPPSSGHCREAGLLTTSVSPKPPSARHVTRVQAVVTTEPHCPSEPHVRDRKPVVPASASPFGVPLAHGTLESTVPSTAAAKSPSSPHRRSTGVGEEVATPAALVATQA